MNKEGIYISLACIAQSWEDRALWEENPEITDRLNECAQQVRQVIELYDLDPKPLLRLAK